MWFLSFIPDELLRWFIHVVVVVGLILTLGGSILNIIPVIKNYTRILGLLGLPILVAGVFFEGGYTTEMMWRNKAKEMAEKVRLAEIESANANKNLSMALATRKAEIDAFNKKLLDDLNKWKGAIDAECKVHPKAIELLNQAAQKPGAKK